MFIGHIPEVGKQALAGVGVTTPVILAISAFAALVSMGGAPKASIFLGKSENRQAEKVLGSCTWMLLLVALDQAPKAIFLTIWRKLILLIPLIFVLPLMWPDPTTGVYLAEPVADTIAICTTAPMFYKYYRALK